MRNRAQNHVIKNLTTPVTPWSGPVAEEANVRCGGSGAAGLGGGGGGGRGGGEVGLAYEGGAGVAGGRGGERFCDGIGMPAPPTQFWLRFLVPLRLVFPVSLLDKSFANLPGASIMSPACLVAVPPWTCWLNARISKTKPCTTLLTFLLPR